MQRPVIEDSLARRAGRPIAVMGPMAALRSIVTMVNTHYLTHISLVVRDLERSLKFYSEVIGVRE